MEKKKKLKTWQIILIIVVVLLICLIAVNLRKYLIMNDLNNKISQYENRDNYYAKVISDNSKLSSYEIYKKDGVQKNILTTDEITMTIFAYPDKTITYVDDDRYNKKTVETKEKTETLGASLIVNYVYSENFLNGITNAAFSKISTEIIAGEEYYVIDSLYNTNFMYQSNCKDMKIYIEKDTGLTSAVVEKIEENGELKDYITTYEYLFDRVTDADVQQPDSSIYTPIQNN